MRLTSLVNDADSTLLKVPMSAGGVTEPYTTDEQHTTTKMRIVMSKNTFGFAAAMMSRGEDGRESEKESKCTGWQVHTQQQQSKAHMSGIGQKELVEAAHHSQLHRLLASSGLPHSVEARRSGRATAS